MQFMLHYFPLQRFDPAPKAGYASVAKRDAAKISILILYLGDLGT